MLQQLLHICGFLGLGYYRYISPYTPCPSGSVSSTWAHKESYEEILNIRFLVKTDYRLGGDDRPQKPQESGWVLSSCTYTSPAQSQNSMIKLYTHKLKYRSESWGKLNITPSSTRRACRICSGQECYMSCTSRLGMSSGRGGSWLRGRSVNPAS